MAFQYLPPFPFKASIACPSLQLAHIELCVELWDLATQWKRLGRELGYEDLQLKKVKRLVMAYSLPLLQMQEDLCFLQVLNSWITGDPEKYKKEVLVKALEATGFQELAEETRRLYKGEPINSCTVYSPIVAGPRFLNKPGCFLY
jgi:hypothetical protein